MMRRVSLAELAASDIHLRPSEAVSIVIEVCRRCHAGKVRGVPPPGVIRLTADGELLIEGPVTTGDDVARAAQLLDVLLAPFDAVPEYRASGALRLAIARALGTLDLPPYGSLDDFSAALTRFSTQAASETARMLFLAWDRARATRDLRTAAPAALTISDIRRARRATGLTLHDVAAIAEVPATQLRDLEWGYMRRWSHDETGRVQLVRYARAAGLDEGLVVSIAWPLIEEAARQNPPVPLETMALVRSGPQHLAALRPRPVSRHVARAGWMAAAVAALVIAVFPAVAGQWSSAPARSAVDVPVALPTGAGQVGSTAYPSAPVVGVPPARRAPARATARATHAAAPARRRPAPTPKRRPSREGSFLNRELFRIVFR